MTDWRERLTWALEALQVDSPSQFTFAGDPFEVAVADEAAAPLEGSAEKEAMLARLGSVLYAQVYSRSFEGRLAQRRGENGGPSGELLAALSAANAAADRWEEGWTLAQIQSGGQIVAHKGAHRRHVWPGQYLSDDGPAAPPRIGARLRLYYARESVSLQPGFYYAFSEAPEQHGGLVGLVRVYWNVTADGAPRLLAELSGRLNRFQVPFRFKCAVSTADFDRTDGAVLYLARRYFGIVADLLRDVLPPLASDLGEEVPLFAKPIARGTGVAEDPGSGESFGQSRCRLLARAVWNCFETSEQSTEARLAELGRLFAEASIEPERPHLNAGSAGGYDLPAEAA